MPTEIKVLFERPPNFDIIVKCFPLATRIETVFSYGDRIYVPSGKKLPREIVAHEIIHCERQQEVGVDHWWEQYCADQTFRLLEETLAHQKEYYELLEAQQTRNARRWALDHVAGKLANKLYGPMISLDRAKKVLKA